MVQLDDPDGAQDPYVLHARNVHRGGHSLPQSRLDPLDLRRPVLAEQQLDRGARDRGSQRIAHERRTVRQHRHLAPRDAVGHARGAQRGGHRQVAAGQCLAEAHDVGRHRRVVRREQRAGAPEPGRDLVEHQQHVVRVARLPQHPQIRGGVEAHPARALDDGLDDHSGQFVGVAFDQGPQLLGVRLLVLGRRRVREHLTRKDPGPQLVHPALGVAHRHRLPGVAVVAATPGQQPLLARAAQGTPVLQAHLDRDLDRDRPGVGEKDMLQAVG